MKMVNPTDRELDVAFAEKVAGWRRGEPERGQKKAKSHYLFSPGYDEHKYSGYGYAVVWKDGLIGGDLPKFSHSADAVRPFLEKGSAHFSRNYFMSGGGKENLWCCHFLWWDESEKKSKEGKGESKSLSLACVIALLRAKGVEVEFT